MTLHEGGTISKGKGKGTWFKAEGTTDAGSQIGEKKKKKSILKERRKMGQGSMGIKLEKN